MPSNIIGVACIAGSQQGHQIRCYNGVGQGVTGRDWLAVHGPFAYVRAAVCYLGVNAPNLPCNRGRG
jgi:hypothetical protein